MPERDRAGADRAPRAVEELLRWDAPIGVLPRILPEDVDHLGYHMPAASTILAGLSSANRDPEVFASPDTFDLDRNPQGHLAFAFGQHFCLGAHLARAEMVVALDVLL